MSYRRRHRCRRCAPGWRMSALGVSFIYTVQTWRAVGLGGPQAGDPDHRLGRCAPARAPSPPSAVPRRLAIPSERANGFTPSTLSPSPPRGDGGGGVEVALCMIRRRHWRWLGDGRRPERDSRSTDCELPRSTSSRGNQDGKRRAAGGPGCTVSHEAILSSLAMEDQPPVFRTEVMCQNVPSLGELVSPLAGSSCADPAQTIRGAERLH